jgi:HD-GYP domain-containing protein (c-di-GMP phosphodiesterase class II)
VNLETSSVLGAPLGVTTLAEEVDATAWIFHEVAEGRPIPLIEGEAIVNAIFAEQKWAARPLLPLLPVRDVPAFLPVHAVNVASLAMALAHSLQFDDASIRRIGLASLFHDVGMVRVTQDVLLKAAQISPEERQRVMRHPVEGARLLLASDPSLDLAAIVAYEHHLRMDGSGYPALLYPRSAHYVSRLVQVCDVFAALSSTRPYRPSWPLEIILSFLNERSGFEFHPALAASLSTLVQQFIMSNAAA